MLHFRIALTLLFLCLFVSPSARAQDSDCLKCHVSLKKDKVVHGALEMCTSCHAGIDAKAVPHRKTNNLAKGLSSEQPDLCYGCHDKALFTKKNVHAAVAMGCTGCHNPHSSKYAKLLVADAPGICFNCHDKTPFAKKVVHAPVAGGMCLTCHNPHSSDEMALLVKRPYDLCVDCHGDVPKKPHAISGFSSSRHPMGQRKKAKTGEERILKNPAQPEKPFYCGSCHEPHSANVERLFRFNAKTGMGLCSNCHKM